MIKKTIINLQKRDASTINKELEDLRNALSELSQHFGIVVERMLLPIGKARNEQYKNLRDKRTEAGTLSFQIAFYALLIGVAAIIIALATLVAMIWFEKNHQAPKLDGQNNLKITLHITNR